MSHPPHLVLLDAHTVNPGDLSWDKLEALGALTVYDHTPSDLVLERAQSADILLVNKLALEREHLLQLSKLKGIVVTATGYNNVDLATAKEMGIPVCNAVGYSTPAVAQHVFALLLAMTSRVYEHNESVHQGDWAKSRDFMYTVAPIHELAGKTLGIYGFGRIGQAVGEIGHAFGMKILATHTHPERDGQDWVDFVSLDQLFSESWAISLHAPMREQNQGIVNAALLAKMQPGSYLINTARGGLIVEEDLREALIKGPLAGAGLDVLSSEPPPASHPLFGIENCIITPHMAWASREARARLIEETVKNVEAIIKGEPRNIVS